jgi:hypothetical protein
MESKTAGAFVFNAASSSSLHDFENLSETTGAKKYPSAA